MIINIDIGKIEQSGGCVRFFSVWNLKRQRSIKLTTTNWRFFTDMRKLIIKLN